MKLIVYKNLNALYDEGVLTWLCHGHPPAKPLKWIVAGSDWWLARRPSPAEVGTANVICIDDSMSEDIVSKVLDQPEDFAFELHWGRKDRQIAMFEAIAHRYPNNRNFYTVEHSDVSDCNDILIKMAGRKGTFDPQDPHYVQYLKGVPDRSIVHALVYWSKDHHPGDYAGHLIRLHDAGKLPQLWTYAVQRLPQVMELLQKVHKDYHPEFTGGEYRKDISTLARNFSDTINR